MTTDKRQNKPVHLDIIVRYKTDRKSFYHRQKYKINDKNNYICEQH